VLLAIDFYEDFIDEKGITVASMLSLQSSSVYGSEFDAPEPDRFATDDNSSFSQQIFDVSMAEIKSIVEPDGITDDIWGESMTLVYIHPPILSILAI
jgi:hypothetical protein